MTFPIYGKSKNVPNHQPDIPVIHTLSIDYPNHQPVIYWKIHQPASFRAPCFFHLKTPRGIAQVDPSGAIGRAHPGFRELTCPDPSSEPEAPGTPWGNGMRNYLWI